MVDLVEVEHIIDSMSDAVVRLEKAVSEKNVGEANNLRTLIFDLHSQIDKMTAI